jgi:hypothetical protein
LSANGLACLRPCNRRQSKSQNTVAFGPLVFVVTKREDSCLVIAGPTDAGYRISRLSKPAAPRY